jgi:fatty acid desaturase
MTEDQVVSRLRAPQDQVDIRSSIKGLSKLSPAASLSAIGFDWVVIAAAIAAAAFASSVPVTVAAILVIGSRQHALLILMHDGAHYRLHPNQRINDLISDVLCAFPFFITTANYRSSHFNHHRYLNTDRDPDWVIKAGTREWTFPKTGRELFGMLLMQASGMKAFHMIGQMRRFAANKKTGQKPKAERSRSGTVGRLLRGGYYCAIFFMVHRMGWWGGFLLLWMLPALTVLPFLLRLRSIAEHFALPHSSQFTASRNVLCGMLERWFIAPHNVGFHLVHHLYPAIPFYRLAKMHETLQQSDEYCREAKINSAYLGFGKESLMLDLLQR